LTKLRKCLIKKKLGWWKKVRASKNKSTIEKGKIIRSSKSIRKMRNLIGKGWWYQWIDYYEPKNYEGNCEICQNNVNIIKSKKYFNR